MKKEAQLGNLQGIILVLVIVGILLGAGFFIFDEFQNQVDNTANTVTAENNSATIGIAHINASGYEVANADATCFNTFAVTGITNRSDGTTIVAANYTVNANTGVITNATALVWPNVTIDYTFRSGSNACGGIADTSTAMLTIPELLGLIILIAVIGVILAVIFNVIPGARVSGA